MSARRMPELPTIAEAALPGFSYDGWCGALCAARTPRAIIDKLVRDEIVMRGKVFKAAGSKAQ
jgi:tripartite-type tricarboxylate transporter receptor subunit TctC